MQKQDGVNIFIVEQPMIIHVVDGYQMIVDILFAMGVIVFMMANFRQLRKIHRTHKTNGISATHCKMKFMASMCMLSACLLGSFPIALVTNLIDITITTKIIFLLAKYRKLSIWRI